MSSTSSAVSLISNFCKCSGIVILCPRARSTHTSTYASSCVRPCLILSSTRARWCSPRGTVALTAYLHQSTGFFVFGLRSPCALLFVHISISSRTKSNICACEALIFVSRTSRTSIFATYFDAFGRMNLARRTRLRKRTSIRTRLFGPTTSCCPDASPSSTTSESPVISTRFIASPLNDTSPASSSCSELFVFFRSGSPSFASSSSSADRALDVFPTLFIVNRSMLPRNRPTSPYRPEPVAFVAYVALARRHSTDKRSNAAANHALDHADPFTISRACVSIALAMCSIAFSLASRRSRSASESIPSPESSSSSSSSFGASASTSTPSTRTRSVSSRFPNTA